MANVERISIELPFYVKLPNREYKVCVDGSKTLGFHVLNGCRKLVRWQQQDDDEVKLVNVASANEVEQWFERIKALGHDEQIAVVRAYTIISVTEPAEEGISPQDWSKRQFSPQRHRAIVVGLNRLLDAYRWAGIRAGSTCSEEIEKIVKVHRLGSAHFLEFVVELFRDVPAPENYLQQLSTFRKLDEEEKGSIPLRLLDDDFGDLVQDLVSRTMPATIRLQLDALSSLLMQNPLQAALLYWAWVDIELNEAYQKVTGNREPQKKSRPIKVAAVKDLYAADQNICDRIERAHRERRNLMVHGHFVPTDEQAFEDFWLCYEFIRFLRSIRKV